jgi:hypothetical protein
MRTMMTENIYGILKRRLPCLKKMTCHVLHAMNIIRACCILHNLAIRWNARLPQDDSDDSGEDDEDQDEEDQAEEENEAEDVAEEDDESEEEDNESEEEDDESDEEDDDALRRIRGQHVRNILFANMP